MKMKEALQQIKQIAEEFRMSVVVLQDDETEGGGISGIMIGYPDYITWMLGDAAPLHEELVSQQKDVH